MTGSDIEQGVLRERYRMLAGQIPLLYAIVIVSTIVASLSMASTTTLMNNIILPGIICVLAGSRAIYWRRAYARVDTQPIEIIKRDFRMTTALGSMMSLVLTVLGIYNITELSPYQQAFTLGTIWMTTVAAAFCLFALPQAAFGVVIGAAVPMSITFLATGQGVLVIAAALMCAIGILIVITLRRSMGAFSDIVDSRARIAIAMRTAERAREEAARLANSDFLTNLANRRHFMSVLDDKFAKVGEEPFALALIDLDGFKPVNDTHGHAVGDEVLRDVGSRLERLMAGMGIAARFGGDEFGLIIDGVESEWEVMAFAELLRAALANRYQTSAGPVDVGASCGIAMHYSALGSGDRLLEYADIALYRAKEAKGKAAVLFHPDMLRQPKSQPAAA